MTGADFEGHAHPEGRLSGIFFQHADLAGANFEASLVTSPAKDDDGDSDDNFGDSSLVGANFRKASLTTTGMSPTFTSTTGT